MDKNAKLWFLFGIGAISVTLGVLSGISASPVATTVVPLVFALLTVSANAYAFSKIDNESIISEALFHSRGKLVGIQLVVFGSTFLFGVWLGILLKAHPSSVWFLPQSDNRLAYVEIEFTNADDLYLLRVIDLSMLADGVGFDERRAILEKIDVGSIVKNSQPPTQFNTFRPSPPSSPWMMPIDQIPRISGPDYAPEFPMAIDTTPRPKMSES